jgi:hypothetical protein
MQKSYDTTPWYKKRWTWILGAVIVIYFGSALVVRLTSDFDKNATTQNNSNTNEQNPTKIDSIAYEVVEQWQLNGGTGKVIVINPKYDNTTDLKKLGEQINNEELSNANSYVYVFSSAEAAQFRKIIKCDYSYNLESAKYSQYRLALFTKSSTETKYTIFEKRDCSDGNNQNTIIEY